MVTVSFLAVYTSTSGQFYRGEIGLPLQPGQLGSPRAIAADPNGNIYIADKSEHKIFRIGSTTFDLFSGGAGSENGKFNSPSGIAFHNSVYVVDTKNNRIQVFSPNGEFIKKWGSLGSGDGQFNSPEGIAIDGAGNVYVTDTGNHRVQKFSADGMFLAKWGSVGSWNCRLFILLLCC
jgi:tripartite motif-containing protein 71